MTIADTADWLDSATPGPVLLENVSQAVPNGNNYTGPVKSTAGLTQLGVILGSSPGQGVESFSVQFYQDSAGTVALGGGLSSKRQQGLSGYYAVAVLGPYYRVGYTNSSGASRTMTYKVFGLASGFRLRSYELQGSPVADLGATASIPVGNYGPAPLSFLTSGSAVVVVQGPLPFDIEVDVWNGTGWVAAWFATISAQPIPATRLNLPTDDWRVMVNNATGAAAAFNTSVIMDP